MYIGMPETKGERVHFRIQTQLKEDSLAVAKLQGKTSLTKSRDWPSSGGSQPRTHHSPRIICGRAREGKGRSKRNKTLGSYRIARERRGAKVCQAKT
jgi:hypothetical protein